MSKDHKITKFFLFSNAVLGGFFLWNSQIILADTINTSDKVTLSQISNSDTDQSDIQSDQGKSNDSNYSINNNTPLTKSVTTQNQNITFIEKDNQYYIYNNESKDFILATPSQIQDINNAKNTNSIQNNYLPVDRQNELDNAVNEKQNTVDDYQIKHDDGYDKNNGDIALHSDESKNNYLNWSDNTNLVNRLQSGELKAGDDLGNGYILHIVDQLSKVPASINNDTDYYQTISKKINDQTIYFYADKNGTLQKWDDSKQDFSDVTKDDQLYSDYKNESYNTEYLNGDSRNAPIADAVENNMNYVIENGIVYKIIKSTKIDKDNLAYYVKYHPTDPVATNTMIGEPLQKINTTNPGIDVSLSDYWIDPNSENSKIDEGINKDHDLKFSTGGGYKNVYMNMNHSSATKGIVTDELVNGYPQLSSGQSLNYLFDSEVSVDGKKKH